MRRGLQTRAVSTDQSQDAPQSPVWESSDPSCPPQHQLLIHTPSSALPIHTFSSRSPPRPHPGTHSSTKDQRAALLLPRPPADHTPLDQALTTFILLHFLLIFTTFILKRRLSEAYHLVPGASLLSGAKKKRYVAAQAQGCELRAQAGSGADNCPQSRVNHLKYFGLFRFF